LFAISDPPFPNYNGGPTQWGRTKLAIFSDTVKFEASSEMVRRVAEMDAAASKRNPNILVAIVASQTVIRGLVNLYRMQSEVAGGTWVTEFFETEPEARKWLEKPSC